MQRLNKKKFIRFIIVLLVILLVIWGLFTLINPNDGDKKNSAGKSIKDSGQASFSISCGGDVMAHSTQIEGAKSGDSYDFSNSFKDLKKVISESDLAMCNLETTFAGEPYQGYPLFSAPDILAKNIKDGGFDAVLSSNNHTMDKGIDGVKRTVKVVKDAGLDITGTVSDPNDKKYLVKDVNGVKVGIVAATYETPMSNGKRTINTIECSDDAMALINSYSMNNFDEDMSKIGSLIDSAKSDGAQVIVCYMHWGEEYSRQADDNQKKTAKKLVNMGADVIFASHPHVMQEIEILESDDGREIPVFFSLGNLLSNQRRDTVDNKYTEQGIIGNVDITYDLKNNKISDTKVGYTPFWVNKYDEGGRAMYRIIPLIDGFEDNETLKASGNLDKAKGALDDIKALLD